MLMATNHQLSQTIIGGVCCLLLDPPPDIGLDSALIIVRTATPALATSQPQCEFTETIPTSPIIIHTADEGFICPGKYRWRIIAQWEKFQGNLQIWENGINGLQFSCLTKLFTQGSNN